LTFPPFSGALAEEAAPKAEKATDAATETGAATEPGKAGAEAVKRVKNLGFRLNSRDGKMPATGTADSTRATAATAAPGSTPLELGRVKEPVALPAELAAVAKEGALAVAEGDWKTARERYLKLVEAAPDNALAYANLGVAEHQLGNLLAAAGNLRKS